MIIVTGATGALNGATVDHLLKRVPASDLAVAVRDTRKAERFAALGIEVRHADYADPDSLPAAFEGADQLLLVSSSDPGADAVSLHGAAIDAAITAGVGRVLYTSHQGAGSDSPFGPARDHARTEELLAASGLPWTALRNGFYAHSLNWLMGQWRETGTIVVPEDGPVSWTAREDLAEAAAIILTSDHPYEGPTTLTAPDAPTFADIAGTASELSGQPAGLIVLGDDEWVTAQVAQGSQEFMARFSLGIYQAAHQGRFAQATPLLRELLGRDPRTVHDLLAEPPAWT